MRTATSSISTLILAATLAGCNGAGPTMPASPSSIQDKTPSRTLVSDLPEFAPKINEVMIANSFDSVDPSFVIGSLVNTKDGTVHPMDNFLRNGVKPKLTPQTEVVFKNFIENSVAANASWLDFVKGQVNDKVHAEVTVTKIAKVTVDISDINRASLVKEQTKIPASKRNDYGIIIGYVDFLLAASYFKDSGAEIGSSGYGAKIGKNWYTKFEDSSAHHRIVAIWSPLPLALGITKSPMKGSMAEWTSEAIENNSLGIQKLHTLVLKY